MLKISARNSSTNYTAHRASSSTKSSSSSKSSSTKSSSSSKSSSTKGSSSSKSSSTKSSSSSKSSSTKGSSSSKSTSTKGSSSSLITGVGGAVAQAAKKAADEAVAKAKDRAVNDAIVRERMRNAAEVIARAKDKDKSEDLVKNIAEGVAKNIGDRLAEAIAKGGNTTVNTGGNSNTTITVDNTVANNSNMNMGTGNATLNRILVDDNTWYSPSTGDQIDIKTGKVKVDGKYPKEYIDGIIKAYETHKMVNGRFVLDNGGQTIGYGHDLLPGENFSGGLSKKEALGLLIKDLNKKYESIKGYIETLNSKYCYNIDINDFSENEKMFLVDFAFNRGAGLVKRPQLKAAGKPYSSLAILITAVSEKNDPKIIDTLMEETKNKKEVYYDGLKLRRMDQYEIYKFGDFVRDYDVERDYTKPKK